MSVLVRQHLKLYKTIKKIQGDLNIKKMFGNKIIERFLAINVISVMCLFFGYQSLKNNRPMKTLHLVNITMQWADMVFLEQHTSIVRKKKHVS